MKDEFDEKLTRFLIEKSEPVTNEKETVWKKIERVSEMKPTPKKRRKRYFVTACIAATCFILIWMGLSTNTGQALIENFREMFTEEKEITFELEGEREETNVELETNENLDYIIYVDKSRYKMITGEKGDKIVPLEDLGAEFPEVSMEIWRTDTDADTMITEIKSDMAALGMTVREIQSVEYPFEATEIRAYGEDDVDLYQWDTAISKFYIMEVEQQLLVFKQMYFLEASEGHAMRFDTMLEHFEVVKDSTN